MQSWHSRTKKKSLLLPFSILLPGASCVMLARVSVWLPSAQDVEIDPAGKKTKKLFALVSFTLNQFPVSPNLGN